MVGGGLRQSGILGAASLYALKNNIQRLAEDHKNAKDLAAGLDSIEPLKGKVSVHTNMVFIEVGQLGKTLLPSFLRSKDILILGSEVLRLVTHLDINENDVQRILSAFTEFFSEKSQLTECEDNLQSVY